MSPEKVSASTWAVVDESNAVRKGSITLVFDVYLLRICCSRGIDIGDVGSLVGLARLARTKKEPRRIGPQQNVCRVDTVESDVVSVRIQWYWFKLTRKNNPRYKTTKLRILVDVSYSRLQTIIIYITSVLIILPNIIQ